MKQNVMVVVLVLPLVTLSLQTTESVLFSYLREHVHDTAIISSKILL
uniref:Uncharacterized protein n=1 Tax=uncultured prokaryote TaxID=198431 RepID=A0A0H5Q0D5_9ZZZZ|nr:hypothetical protein [uncultured prokaryote]